MKKRQNIDIVWNNAVSKVGTLNNTLGNFSNIATEFTIQAKKDGYAKEEVKKEISENFQSTVGFMQ